MRNISPVCLLVVCTLLFGCSKEGNILIGSSLPLTGGDASYGQHARNGLEIAREEINRGGGIDGKQVEFLYEDDAGVPKNGISIMNKFTDNPKIKVVIGAVHSTVTLAMASVANKKKLLLVSPISSSAQLTKEGGAYFVRIAPSDAFQARILATWVYESGYRKAGIIFVNNIWGASLAEEFEMNFSKNGGRVVAKESSKVGDTDFRTPLSKVHGQQPDAFVFLTQAKEGGIAIKQAKELGYKLPIFGGDTWSSVEFITSAGDAVEGVRIVMPAQYTGKAFRDFAKTYTEKYGEEPDVNAAYSYDTLKIIALAIKNVGYESDKIREFLLKMPSYSGASGITKFDKHGDSIAKDFQRIMFRGGKKVPVVD